jgi:hypothetical protein
VAQWPADEHAARHRLKSFRLAARENVRLLREAAMAAPFCTKERQKIGELHPWAPLGAIDLAGARNKVVDCAMLAASGQKMHCVNTATIAE